MLKSWVTKIVDNRISSLTKKMDEVTENMSTIIRNAYALSLLVKENRDTLQIVLKIQTALLRELAGDVVDKKMPSLSMGENKIDDDLLN